MFEVYTLTPAGKTWANSPKDSLGGKFSKLRTYMNQINDLLLKSEQVTKKDLMYNTKIEGKSIEHIMTSYEAAGFVTIQRSFYLR